MTKKETFALSNLRDNISARALYATRDEAWKDLQDFAEEHGYGSRFCALDSGMEWLMSSQNIEVRMKALKLYGNYCAASANVDTAKYIGQALANLGI